MPMKHPEAAVRLAHTLRATGDGTRYGGRLTYVEIADRVSSVAGYRVSPNAVREWTRYHTRGCPAPGCRAPWCRGRP